MSRRSSGAGREYARNSVRIIAGAWRGRRLAVAPGVDLRPTGDRVRETLFNWLQSSVAGSRCLDLYAGSGALGLEAASRGAADVVLVDRDPAVVTALRETLARLGPAPVSVIEQPALEYLAGTPRAFDLVFLDPPFGAVDLGQVCVRLGHGWLAPAAWIYVEQPAQAAAPLVGWRTLREKVHGQVRFGLYCAD